MLMFLFWWTILSFVIGVAATFRFDRNGFGWFLFAFLLSPIIAGLFLLALGTPRPPPVVIAPQKGVDWTKIDWSGKAEVAAPAPAAPATVDAPVYDNTVQTITVFAVVGFVALAALLVHYFS